jgi:hypothetical protein
MQLVNTFWQIWTVFTFIDNCTTSKINRIRPVAINFLSKSKTAQKQFLLHVQQMILDFWPVVTFLTNCLSCVGQLSFSCRPVFSSYRNLSCWTSPTCHICEHAKILNLTFAMSSQMKNQAITCELSIPTQNAKANITLRHSFQLICRKTRHGHWVSLKKNYISTKIITLLLT